MNKYITLFALAALANIECEAQPNTAVPRLVVGITIDQLNSNDMEHFAALYGNGGFKKLLNEGVVYENAQYDFAPVNLASASTAIATGASPTDNGITAERWISRETLRPVGCTFDKKLMVSPNNVMASTIGDEMKMASNGNALVFSVAANQDAAVLHGGHAADGVFWMDESSRTWKTSAFYPRNAQTWLDAYLRIPKQGTAKKNDNQTTCQLALDCINDHAMGRDAYADLLFVTLSAGNVGTETNPLLAKEAAYRELDRTLADLILNIEQKVGKDNVLFVLTSTGRSQSNIEDYAKYNVPTGTFYINRTANLLNMYLNAIYGINRLVDGVLNNEIYINKTILEQKRINISEVLRHAREFLVQIAGVKEVYTADQLLLDNSVSTKTRNAFNHAVSGDIIVKITPGWRIYNEETKEEQLPSLANMPFPIIIYGADVKPKAISTPVSTNSIAPTIARFIRIRAPNACVVSALPLK
jgi:hypothetical protein